jgi:8-oxo-dGTP pyrophosphatase MutT (NUDIX family)
MAQFHVKKKKGRPYLYVREIARVDGKPKVVSQIYLGSPERVAAMAAARKVITTHRKIKMDPPTSGEKQDGSSEGKMPNLKPKIGELIRPSAVMENLHPVPIVRLIVMNEAGKVLLLRRSNAAYGDGLWCLPGGKVDYGELVEDACRKELSEETGIECQSPRFLFFQNSLPPSIEGMHCINLYFECRATSSVKLNRESSDFAWIGPDDLDGFDIAFRNDEALLRYWG